MKFLKNNLCTILTLALFFCVAMIDTASADVFGVAQNKGLNLFSQSKLILFVIGGFGLMALAFQAIFGKLKWAWFAALAFGLAVVSAAGGVVDYASNGGSKNVSSGFSDSLK
jgi:hypothetical protein